MKYIPHNYQRQAADHIINNTHCGLFLEMGLGKTVATLTAIEQLLFDRFEISRVLIIAPKRVAQSTWPEELSKWDHLQHLTCSIAVGTTLQRDKALKASTSLCCINRENVSWLIENYNLSDLGFDMLVIDELSSFKSATAARFKALRRVSPAFKRIVGLTGTPAPNGLIDLWPQVYLLDRGARLEQTLGNYRRKYFTPGRSNGYVVFNYNPIPGADKMIGDKLSDICLSMKSADYLTLPDRIDREVYVSFPKPLMDDYRKFEKEQVMKIDDEYITAINAATLTCKLLQWSNGAIYDECRCVHHLHYEKIKALEDIIEAASGAPVLIFYSFLHDRDRILSNFKSFDPQTINRPADIEKWNHGKIRLLLCHPASAGHGLNLQAGGNIIIWYGLPWSLELYQQANARLHRQGQTKPVIVHHILSKGTADLDVYKALSKKELTQETLMAMLKRKQAEYTMLK